MAPLGGRVLVIEVGDDRPCFLDVQKSLDEGNHLKSRAHFKSIAIFRHSQHLRKEPYKAPLILLIRRFSTRNG